MWIDLYRSCNSDGCLYPISERCHKKTHISLWLIFKVIYFWHLFNVAIKKVAHFAKVANIALGLSKFHQQNITLSLLPALNCIWNDAWPFYENLTLLGMLRMLGPFWALSERLDMKVCFLLKDVFTSFAVIQVSWISFSHRVLELASSQWPHGFW